MAQASAPELTDVTKNMLNAAVNTLFNEWEQSASDEQKAAESAKL